MVRDGSSSGGKAGVGRALVKQHNQTVQLAKEKGRTLRKQRVLESVTEVGDIDAVIEQAEEAGRIFDADNPLPDVLNNLDLNSDLTPEERREQQKREEVLFQSSLRLPRRPSWSTSMSPEELDENERNAFLSWRRSLARLEENEKLVLTPFEKNLDIWRQLWRVVERSDLIVMVVDARDPLFYRCPDLEEYAKEIDEHKETVLLVNKADLLPFAVRKIWARYFRVHGIQHIFWSAKAATAAFGGKKLNGHWRTEEEVLPSDLSHEGVKIYGRDELLARLHREGKTIVEARGSFFDTSMEQTSHPQYHYPTCGAKNSDKKVVVGFVGYPNVGKSSTINALVGEKRTGVTSTPGKTKHFQTLIISEELMLCDCPGLVFPSFSSSRYDMVALGVLPIDRMTEHRQALQIVADHVPRVVLEKVYNISLPKPKPYESQCRPPFSSELLRAYCSSRGYVSSSGLPDETRAARQILKDYIDGKLTHFKLPPELPADVFGEEIDERMGISHSDLSDHVNRRVESDSEEPHEASEDAVSSDVANLLNDLDAFDSSTRLAGSVAYAKEKKPVATKHKHHKKPQKKKDRSWRVPNDGGDGMPVVRVFQKPVSFGAMRAT